MSSSRTTISFNYDRSVEQYLSHALSNYYRIGLERAQKIVASLEILHPYGTVGKLPWQRTERGVPYGGEGDASELLYVTSQLRTFTEQIEDKSLIESMRAALAESDCVVFLGFAFHEINMKLLEFGAPHRERWIYGTAHGISSEDCEVITGDIARRLCSKPQYVSIRQVKCTELFDQFRFTLSRFVTG